MSICEIKPHKPQFLPNPGNKEFVGSYLSPNYPIRGLNKTRWAVGMYLYYQPVYRKTLGNDDLFIQHCLDELNEPQPMKYSGRGRRPKKEKTPPYGFLEVYRYTFKEAASRPYLILEATTTDRKNKNFYKADIVGQRQRGRPRKETVDEV